MPVVFAALSFVFGIFGGIAKQKAAMAKARAIREETVARVGAINDKIAFVRRQTQVEFDRFNESVDRVQSAVKARVGASGLRSSAGEAVLQSNAIQAQKDIDQIRLGASFELSNLRTEANLVMQQGTNLQRQAVSGGAAAFNQSISSGFLSGLKGLGSPTKGVSDLKSAGQTVSSRFNRLGATSASFGGFRRR